jgi:hypothetical protein
MRRLYCLTYAGGNASFFKGIKKRIEMIGHDPGTDSEREQNLEVIPVEYSGRGSRSKEPDYMDFQELTLDMAARINDFEEKADVPSDELFLFGYSMGSIAAFEIVKQKLLAQMPLGLFVAAHLPPHIFHIEKEYDLMDDHYYTNPRVFPTMNEKYAGEGDMVYVGEYACNSEVGYGNLLAAISEATFMTAMENCADRVRIASYAPLFCNDHDRRWPVNLINFDNNHVFGLPSYYVQKLFACDTVEKVVATDNNVVIGKSDNLYLTAGVKGDTLIIKAANFNPHRILSTFTCDGIAAGEASVSLVTGDKETDTNSLLYPEYVSESRFTIPTEDGSVNYEFAPYSFAVIRVKLA